MLDAEDVWFSKPHYAFAMAQYCTANGITAEELREGTGPKLDAAREYAVKEAQKATYRDSNSFSDAVSEWGRRANKKNVVTRGVSTVLEGILPFRKTPANILVRGMEYSPAGLLKSLSYDLYQVKQGNMTGAEMIDNLSAGLTGTGLLALGLWLASQGLIRGHGGDDKDKRKFEALRGRQERHQKHPLVPVLKVLQELLRFLSVGGEVGGKNVHVIPGADRFFLFLDLGAVQVGDLPLSDCPQTLANTSFSG